MTARARSKSIGRVAKEGVNPYKRTVTSTWQLGMIERGREQMGASLTEVAGCEVRFVQTVMRGSDAMDEFAFRRSDVAGSDQIELFAKLRRLASMAQASEGIVLVYVSQATYDKRIAGLDLSCGQCAAIIGVLLFCCTLLAIASEQISMAPGRYQWQGFTGT
jgi:hypothetical protein